MMLRSSGCGGLRVRVRPVAAGSAPQTVQHPNSLASSICLSPAEGASWLASEPDGRGKDEIILILSNHKKKKIK